MSISRRRALTGGAAAAAAIGAKKVDASTTIRPHHVSASDLQVTIPDEWTGATMNALCKEIADLVIETVVRTVPLHEQRTVLAGVSSHLLHAGLKLPGDEYADNGEPRGSVVGIVMDQYMAASPGVLGMLDATMPGDAYVTYTRDCAAVAHLADEHPSVGRLMDSSMYFATEMGWVGCRLGAHLTVANVNAIGIQHESEQRRYRSQMAAAVQSASKTGGK